MIIIEVIPYKTFREKIKITKDIMQKVKPTVIEVYSNYIYIEIIGGTDDDRRV